MPNGPPRQIGELELNRTVVFDLVRRSVLRPCAMLLAIGLGGVAYASGSPGWNLGPDPDATILIFDISGGQRPRSAEGPLLKIAASGAASARASRPGKPRVSASLSPAQLAALLDAVVSDLGAFEIDADAIGTAVAAAGGRPSRIADASTTSLVLALGDRRHTISVYALPQQASMHPEVEALQRFLEIRRLLQAEAAAIAGEASGAAPAKTGPGGRTPKGRLRPIRGDSAARGWIAVDSSCRRNGCGLASDSSHGIWRVRTA